MKYLLAILLLTITINGISQTDPNTYGILVNSGLTLDEIRNMETTMDEIKSTSKELKEAQEAVSFIQNLKSVQRTIKVLDNIVCNSKLLQMYLGFSTLYNSCMGKIDVQLTLVDLQSSMDLINLVITSGLTMSQGERIQSWNDALDRLEEAQRRIMRLNYSFRFALQNDIVKQYNAQKSATFQSMSRY